MISLYDGFNLVICSLVFVGTADLVYYGLSPLILDPLPPKVKREKLL